MHNETPTQAPQGQAEAEKPLSEFAQFAFDLANSMARLHREGLRLAAMKGQCESMQNELAKAEGR